MSIDSNLEEAGELMGASRGRILRKITFPLVLPAILSGFIMTFSRVMGTFGGPNVLGVPVRYYTLSTMIRSDMKLGNNSDGFVLAIMLILLALITVYINQKAMGTKKSYETIGGRGFVTKKTKLRKWNGILTVLVILVELLIAVLPVVLLSWNTFMKNSGDYSLGNFTLQHWIGASNPEFNDGVPGILRNPLIYKGAWNSIRLSLVASFFVAILGMTLGYAIVKGRGTWLAKSIEQLAFVPYVIPGIAFGAVYISMFAKPVGPIPALIWHLCLAGDRLGGKEPAFFQPFRNLCHDASRPGVGGGGRGCRSGPMVAFQAHHLPAHPWRLCFGLPFVVYHLHA